MSLDKAIKYGKEKRKPYRGAKACDPNCRNNGDCDACRKNRQHNTTRKTQGMEFAIREIWQNPFPNEPKS